MRTNGYRPKKGKMGFKAKYKKGRGVKKIGYRKSRASRGGTRM